MNCHPIAIEIVISLFLRVVLSSDVILPGEVSMGTTILAVRYKGGVVCFGILIEQIRCKINFCSGSRNRYFCCSLDPKILFKNIAPSRSIYVCYCRSGSAANTQHLASIVCTDLVSRQLLYRIHGTITQVASLLRNLLSNDSSLSSSLICAGYDHELERGVIYLIAPGGTIFEEKIWAVGSLGLNYILGYLDASLPKGPDENIDYLINSEEEALDIVCNAISLAMDQDGSSGGFI
ncbi:hypothetical protein ACHAW6_008389 [Cyclotella cf. meneghiniana]